MGEKKKVVGTNGNIRERYMVRNLFRVKIIVKRNILVERILIFLYFINIFEKV